MRRVLAAAATVLLLASCGKKAENAPAESAAAAPNQRRIDSAIAKSKIPGARGVGDAMTATDRANAQVRMQDSLAALMNK